MSIFNQTDYNIIWAIIPIFLLFNGLEGGVGGGGGSDLSCYLVFGFFCMKLYQLKEYKYLK